MHPPPMPGQGPPQGPPGALDPNTPAPAEAVSVAQLNDMYLQQKQNLASRLEAESRGYDNVFAQ